MKKSSFKKNGEKGGRPKGNSYSAGFVIPGFSTVILTENQYYILNERFGADLINRALNIFEEWLATSPLGYKYKGKNNYAHFRADGWVINEAKSSIRQT